MRFHAPSALPVELFFCMDSTGSMAGTDADHRATESIAEFLNDLAAEGFPLRVGGIKFNAPAGSGGCGDDLIEMEQFASLSSYSTVGSFISGWVNNGYSRNGGDWKELQLDALHIAAQDMMAYSTSGNPHRYIVLITDYDFHENTCGSTVTKQQVINELTASGCRIYISLWQPPSDPWMDDAYLNLLVNTGEFDPGVFNMTIPPVQMYPLTRLRNRIMAY